MDIFEVLATAKAKNASDLHLSAGNPPLVRVNACVHITNISGYWTKIFSCRLIRDLFQGAFRTSFLIVPDADYGSSPLRP